MNTERWQNAHGKDTNIDQSFSTSKRAKSIYTMVHVFFRNAFHESSYGIRRGIKNANTLDFCWDGVKLSIIIANILEIAKV